jgi:signal transduction histidine kinase
MNGYVADRALGKVTLAVLRYGSAGLAVAAGVLVASWLEPVLDASVVLLVAIVLTTWFGGLGPALLGSVLATLAYDYFFSPPLHTITVEIAHIPRMLVFTLTSVMFVSLSASRRRAERSLVQARDGLEVKVRERTADLTSANEELEKLAGRLIGAQEEERSRIGRELHDHISQMLGVLTIRLDQLRLDAATPERVAATLEELRERMAEVTTDIHGLSHRLHSSALDYLGLGPALGRLTTEFSTRHQIAIDFAPGPLPVLPPDVALCLFRVTEESLTNIAKHSDASSARVTVRSDADGVSLTVEDAGIGFDVDALERRAGLGFVSMRERLRLVRGTVRVDSVPSRGTRIDVWVPAASLVLPETEAAPGASTGPVARVSVP